MTKEQILALNLSAEEKKQVESAYEVQRRLNAKGGNTKCSFDGCADEAAVKALCVTLKTKADKRKAAATKKAEKAAASTEIVNKVVDLLAKAKTAGLSEDDVIKAIEDKIKVKYNADLQAKIDALKAQMI